MIVKHEELAENLEKYILLSQKEPVYIFRDGKVISVLHAPLSQENSASENRQTRIPFIQY